MSTYFFDRGTVIYFTEYFDLFTKKTGDGSALDPKCIFRPSWPHDEAVQDMWAETVLHRLRHEEGRIPEAVWHAFRC